MLLCVCVYSSVPVIFECIRYGLADELTVFLQRVEGVLNGLVNGFFNGTTHFLNLVDTTTWLHRTITVMKSVQ